MGRRKLSALAGGGLILLAFLWFLWLLVRQLNPGINSVVFPLPGFPSNTATSTPTINLASAGITLSAPPQSPQPGISRQQALLLANQIEPEISAQAGKEAATYTLFSYGGGTSTTLTSFHNVPVWLVEYTQISQPPPSTAADPHAVKAMPDFYLVLDANSGQELFAVWL